MSRYTAEREIRTSILLSNSLSLRSSFLIIIIIFTARKTRQLIAFLSKLRGPSDHTIGQAGARGETSAIERGARQLEVDDSQLVITDKAEVWQMQRDPLAMESSIFIMLEK